MTSATVALGVAAIVFAGGVVGLSLQHALPEKYTTCGIILVFVAEQGYPYSGAVVWTQFYSKSAYREAWCPIRRSPGPR